MGNESVTECLGTTSSDVMTVPTLVLCHTDRHMSSECCSGGGGQWSQKLNAELSFFKEAEGKR